MMKSRKAASLRRAASTALLELELPTGSKLSNAIIIADARRRFGDLPYQELKMVQELWELTTVLEQMYQDYRCSPAAADQGTAGSIEKFLVRHRLRT